MIDADGSLLQRTGIAEAGVLYATVEQREGLTWAVRWGEKATLVAAAGLLTVAAVRSALDPPVASAGPWPAVSCAALAAASLTARRGVLIPVIHLTVADAAWPAVAVWPALLWPAVAWWAAARAVLYLAGRSSPSRP